MDVVKELFGITDLYEVIGVAKEEVDNEKCLRSAYMKAALKYHPDKAPVEQRETYTKKFQVIKRVYELFKDAELRKVYDETGSWPEDEQISLDVESFGRLDENAVLEFKKMYQGSDEERQDIKKYYEESNGDIFHICDNVFFLNVLDDEKRVNSIIDSMIENGETEKFTKGVKSAKLREQKLKKARKEATEAEEIRKEKNLDGGFEGLKNAILKNRSAKSSFLDDLAAKYGGADSKKAGKKKAGISSDGPANKKSKLISANEKDSRTTRSRSKK